MVGKEIRFNGGGNERNKTAHSSSGGLEPKCPQLPILEDYAGPPPGFWDLWP